MPCQRGCAPSGRAPSPISSLSGFLRMTGYPMIAKPPQAHKLEIRQPLTAADASRVDALDAIIILLPESSLQKRWPDFPHSERLKKRVPEGKTSFGPTRADLPNPR